MTPKNLAPEVSVFPALTLKEAWDDNRGYSYITVMESQVIEYVSVNNPVDFMREKVNSRRTVVVSMPVPTHWRDLLKSGIHFELQVQLSLPVKLTCLSWLHNEASQVPNRREGSLPLTGMLLFIQPRMWLVSITARAHLMFNSLITWTLRSFSSRATT